MRGVGRANGAITIVNALATGVGCACGIELTAEAEVEMSRTGAPTAGRHELDPDCDTPLARATLRSVLHRYAPEERYDVHLSVRSQIPTARGLKSSSAVSCAIVLAVLNALRHTATIEEVAGLSAEISQEIGLSATGAFDDAMAGLSGGLVVTDNARRTVLRRDPVDPEWLVLLFIPRRPHQPSTEYRDRFSQARPDGLAASDAALEGAYFEAMRRNTELVERLLGYSYRPLRARLGQCGALASGVSGMGPTLATVVERGEADEVRDALPVGTADRITAAFARRTYYST